MRIVLIKTIGGETVVCKMIMEKDNYIVIQDPIIFVLSQDNKGRPITVPVNWIPGLAQGATVKVYKDKLLTEPVSQEFIEASLVRIYTKTTTGLDVPTPDNTKGLKLVKG